MSKFKVILLDDRVEYASDVIDRDISGADIDDIFVLLEMELDGAFKSIFEEVDTQWTLID